MSAYSLLNLFYPLSQQMPEDMVNKVLSVADNKRPDCLSDEKQDEAWRGMRLICWLSRLKAG
ncbi:hypothetical protein [Haemophilus influenzae]|uniref:hypothetical protein n=1 Tax=Haemophilus influenzae TaxID=727 RepID=UPI001FD76AF8|nr:hypothetical protein [Haemophilus influenzae]